MAGKVLCLDCGSPLHRGGVAGDGKERYLRCHLAKKTRNAACTPHNVSERRIERLIEQRIKELIDGTLEKDAKAQEIAQGVFLSVENINQSIEIKKRQLLEMEARNAKIQNNIKLTYEDKLNSVLSAQEFIIFRNAFHEEEAINIKRKKQLESEIEGLKVKASKQVSITDLLAKYKSVDILSHEIVNDFIDNIQVGERNTETNEQEIIINWNF